MSGTDASGRDRGHERYEELVVGHALHALEPGDEAVAAEHLRTCDSCRRLAADAEAVGAGLAVLAPPVEPPAELGERLRAAVAAEPRRPRGDRPAAGLGEPVRRLGPRSGPDRSGPDRPGPDRPGHERPGGERPGGDRSRPARSGPGRGSADGARPDGRRDRPARWQRAAPWLVTAAAVAALAVVTGWGTSTSGQRDELLRATELQEQVLDRLADPAARVVRLAAQDGASGASAAVVLDEGGQAYVVVEGLEPTDPQSTYVLWQVPEGGAPEAVGVFDVGAEDVAVAQVGAVTLEPERLAALAVSREAGRVAPATPSTPVLVGTPTSA